jgi:transcriptional regulator with XRE-family HTH domain
MEKDNRQSVFGMDFFQDLTGEIEAPPQKDIEEVGARIRKIRKEKGLSLQELSRLTGFEENFLAGIESNDVQPQLGTVIKLSKALDSAFGRIVSGVGDRLFSITRKNERRTVSRSSDHDGKQHLYAYKSLAPDVKGRHMEALIVQLEQAQTKDISIHEGEEFIFVLNGIVELQIGDESFDLEPGDSVYYLSTTPHFIAAKSGRATILAVLYEGE